MARSPTRHISPVLPRPIVWLLTIGIGCFSSTAVAAPGRTWAAPLQPASREGSLARIASVQEHRVPDHELSEETKAKLLFLSDRQVRIAASLAERIANDDPAVIAETASPLLTPFIILP
jgi:hypothetical protein